MVRLPQSAAYSFRISKVQTQSDDLQKQRELTIEKLKNATKYNTTQQLLEKYGGTPPSKQSSTGSGIQKKVSDSRDSHAPGPKRTTFVPPPTANIPGRNVPASLPVKPQQATPRSQFQQDSREPFSAAAAVAPWQKPSSPLEPSADFAPNAFSSAPQYAPPRQSTHWYDRFLDVLLGEDETLPRNRLALICHECRLVNGQAPPGVQRLEDVGRWKCAGCGHMNGEEKEEVKLLKKIKEHGPPPRNDADIMTDEASPIDETSESVGETLDEDDDEQYGDSSESLGSERGAGQVTGKTTGVQRDPDTPRRRSSRVKRKSNG
ncbi:MAG: hypothetical protein Q9174_002480 [Haloplaca sp. 1 TL-2023]